jgi:hypothetical protein
LVARTYLYRAWIDAVLDDATRAFTGALFAAWACDDSGLEAAAAELRAQAIEYWMAAHDAGAPAYAGCAIGVSEAVAPRCYDAAAVSPKASSREWPRSHRRGSMAALKARLRTSPIARPAGITQRTKWAPSPDHYPTLKSAGGQLVPENVRLSHIWCNNRDYGWRTQIRTLLAKGKSLAEIAEALNSKGVPPAHGTNRWTAAMVRKAYVS